MKKVLVIFIFSLVASYWFQGQHIFEKKCYYFSFLDIGQGDSVLITTPKDHNILIDGGPQNTVLDRLGEAMPWWDRAIDIVILSHPHADHLDGLIPVLERFKVKKFILTGTPYASSQYQELLNILATSGQSYDFAQAGQVFSLNGLNLKIFYPLEPLLGQEAPENINNTSIVGLIAVDGFRFLFSGDAENEEELEFLKLNTDYRADLFKAGHHGSRTSSSQAFLDRIQPQYAVIQSGIDNPFGHPHPETVERLLNNDIKLFRNDLQGTVTFKVCRGQVDSIMTSR